MSFEMWKLADLNIIAPLPFLAAAWRWGDWRHWRKYYPTILFFLVVYFAYGYITYNQPLWQLESPLLKSTLSDVYVALVGQSAAVLLFLSRYPRTLYRQVLYIAMWVALYSAIELAAFQINYISYHNGWNLWYSVLFNCFMFPILRLHHTNILRAWLLTFAIAIAIAMIMFFDISLSKMK